MHPEARGGIPASPVGQPGRTFPKPVARICNATVRVRRILRVDFEDAVGVEQHWDASSHFQNPGGVSTYANVLVEDVTITGQSQM